MTGPAPALELEYDGSGLSDSVSGDDWT